MAVLQAVGKKSVPPEVAFSWWGCQGTMARSRTWGHLPLAHIIPEAGAQSPPSGSFPPTGSSALVVPTNSPLLGPMSHIYGPSQPSLSPFWDSSLCLPGHGAFRAPFLWGVCSHFTVSPIACCPPAPVEATRGPCLASGS